MESKFVTNISVSINAPIAKVWDALINPEMIKKYMFGSEAISDWKEGSPIIWKGDWNGQSYQDHGVVLKIEPMKVLQYSHFGSVGKEVPESYPIVTCTLSQDGEQVLLSLSQDNNPSEEVMEVSKKNWEMMMNVLKKEVEG